METPETRLNITESSPEKNGEVRLYDRGDVTAGTGEKVSAGRVLSVAVFIVVL